jgi:hypothetical protein
VPAAWSDLPRAGVRLRLPGRFAHLEWFGLGPHETYADRRASGRTGRFDSTVAAQYVPYVVPQEHGHHEDTRWLLLCDASGAGVRITGPPSASPRRSTASKTSGPRGTPSISRRATVGCTSTPPVADSAPPRAGRTVASLPGQAGPAPLEWTLADLASAARSALAGAIGRT